MKKIIIIIVCVVCTISFAVSTKEIKLNFDTSKFSVESIGDSTLFNYKDSRSQLVQRGKGAPVMPCITIDVLMPKGATFKNCKSKAQALELRGKYKVYTRLLKETKKSAFEQYPPRLVEFVGRKDINGCNIFSFRAFPITCVPKKGKVNKILQTSLLIEYDIPSGDGTYSMESITSLMSIKKIVVNQDDVKNMICYEEYNSVVKSKYSDPLSRMRTSMNQEICQGNGAEMLSMLKTKPNFSSSTKQTSLDDMIQENLYINDNNDIVFAPISF